MGTGDSPFYFQGYGILCSIFFTSRDVGYFYFHGYWIFMEVSFWDVCNSIRDT